MSTSVRNAAYFSPKRSAVKYSLISAFCLLVFLIYNLFSHGVTSIFMTFLFLWPLLLGTAPALIFLFARSLPRPQEWSLWMYRSGVACCTVSSLLRGILEISGTASAYQVYLMGAGWIFLGLGIVLYFFRK